MLCCHVRICSPSATTAGDHQAFGLHGVFTVRMQSTAVSRAGRIIGMKATKLNAQTQTVLKHIEDVSISIYTICIHKEYITALKNHIGVK